MDSLRTGPASGPDQPQVVSPAEVYDTQFVPALFQPFSEVVAEAGQVGPGQRVLDVACGTGALTCAAIDRAGPAGVVVGLDANPEMLAVARRKPVAVQWVEGRAEALPFPDRHFDAVLSQFGLMFFDEPVRALREMQRVLRPGGRLAVAVCDAVERCAGYAVLASLLQELFGRRVAEAFRAPFSMGDAERLRSLCQRAGWQRAEVQTRSVAVRFRSIDAMVATERACVWTLGGLLDEAQFTRLRAAARPALQPFADADGRVAFPLPALLITARKP